MQYSFKTQLIFGITFVISSLLILFVYITTKNYNDSLRQEGLKQSLNQLSTVATSSKVWIMSNDYVGLEEIIENFSVYDDLMFVAIINLEAKVIAHSQSCLVGTYIADKERLAYIESRRKASKRAQQDEETLLNNGNYIDIIGTVYNGAKVIGFVNIRTDQSVHLANINTTIRYSLFFILISLMLAFLFAYATAKGLTTKLFDLINTMKRVSAGDRNLQADENNVKEIAALAHEFNSMLRSLNSTEKSNLHQVQMLKQVHDSVISTDIDGNITSWNQGSQKMLGYTESEVLGKNISLIHRDEDVQNYKEYAVQLIESDSLTVESYLVSKSKKAIPVSVSLSILRDEDSNPVGMIGVSHDISERQHTQRALIEQKNILEYQAHHDALTNLPNRLLFLDRLKHTIERAKRYHKKFAVLFIDLDRFKQINDSLGHDYGDEVLQIVSDRLLNKIRREDTLARLGGDEFTIIIEDLDQEQSVSILAEKILNSLVKPMTIKGNILYISCSIGISLYPKDDIHPLNLLKYADAAMYKAKDEGRNNFQFYSSDMTKKALEHIKLESNFRDALKNEEFIVYYQPQIDAKENKLIGMEALVRWNSPHGFITPDKFIPLAEETGLIVALDRWVMRTAMMQHVAWYNKGLNPGVLAMNLSVKQLQSSDFIEVITQLLTETKCSPSWIELEVTEGEIMLNPKEAILTLHKISNMGIELAIDDFGTGYSSLSYLKRLPIDKLKIDQSFVKNLPCDDEEISIARAVIALAKSLELSVIAEGVENREQKDFLIENGCSNIQGYYYSKPMPCEKMEVYLREM